MCQDDKVANYQLQLYVIINISQLFIMTYEVLNNGHIFAEHFSI